MRWMEVAWTHAATQWIRLSPARRSKERFDGTSCAQNKQDHTASVSRRHEHSGDQRTKGGPAAVELQRAIAAACSWIAPPLPARPSQTRGAWSPDCTTGAAAAAQRQQIGRSGATRRAEHSRAATQQTAGARTEQQQQQNHQRQLLAMQPFAAVGIIIAGWRRIGTRRGVDSGHISPGGGDRLVPEVAFARVDVDHVRHERPEGSWR